MRKRALLLASLVTVACQSENVLYSTVCYEPCYTGPPETEGVGLCSAGEPICEDRIYLSCGEEILPTDEYCGGLDNDCNGTVDDETLDEEVGNTCGSNIGECSYGYLQCIEGGIDCVGAVSSTEETCDNRDNDCNGLVDDIEFIDYCYEFEDGSPRDWNEVTSGGECQVGWYACDAGVRVCEGQVVPSEEVCDELDNDCDGFIDEDLTEDSEVDIVFVLDRSGSMNTHFASVANAAQIFASSFTGVPEFRFALVGIPHTPGTTEVEVLLDFSDASTFVTMLSTMSTTGGGHEASYDAPYMAANGDLGLTWRSGDVRRYIVLFTDEAAQSYVSPSLSETDVADELVAQDIKASSMC